VKTAGGGLARPVVGFHPCRWEVNRHRQDRSLLPVGTRPWQGGVGAGAGVATSQRFDDPLSQHSAFALLLAELTGDLDEVGAQRGADAGQLCGAQALTCSGRSVSQVRIAV
jgi:hypothetical protein